ncbi:hypothetical protein, partial [uncultured Gammaproteobacteria bacterium]
EVVCIFIILTITIIIIFTTASYDSYNRYCGYDFNSTQKTL